MLILKKAGIMNAKDFIEKNYTLSSVGSDYIYNHSGQLVDAEDIAEAYHKEKMREVLIEYEFKKLSYSLIERYDEYTLRQYAKLSVDNFLKEREG